MQIYDKIKILKDFPPFLVHCLGWFHDPWTPPHPLTNGAKLLRSGPSESDSLEVLNFLLQGESWQVEQMEGCWRVVKAGGNFRFEFSDLRMN